MNMCREGWPKGLGQWKCEGVVLRGRRWRIAPWPWDLAGEDLWPQNRAPQRSVLIPWKL